MLRKTIPVKMDSSQGLAKDTPITFRHEVPAPIGQKAKWATPCQSRKTAKASASNGYPPPSRAHSAGFSLVSPGVVGLRARRERLFSWAIN